MTNLALTVNGQPRELNVASRVSLADALRETCGLTGTHLGCEQGVCGACTILLDGQPARSCITFAVACAGAEVTTIEGLNDEELAAQLRSAFTRHHALQCGFCTPGMLISARDLVLRLPEPDESAIRVGLSGNLCRCTGYVGIVNAVREVIAARRAAGVQAVRGGGRAALGPVGAVAAVVEQTPAAPAHHLLDPPLISAAVVEFTPTHKFTHNFFVGQSCVSVFAFFADLSAVAAAIPGLTLTSVETNHAKGAFAVGLGPVRAQFRGEAEIARYPDRLAGRILAAGGDLATASRARGVIEYVVRPSDKGAIVELDVGYTLTGLLGQLGRPGLVEAVARRLIAKFAENIENEMSGIAVARISLAERFRGALARLLG